jgi:predicted PurR-regulated permease PerM
MEFLYFLLVAIVLYWLSDQLLDLLERRYQRRFANRTLIFFAILFGLALAAFALIRMVFDR